MPSSIFTQLGLWNKALLKIGAQRLNSLTDSTNPAAQYLADIYPFELPEFLEEHPWSFAVSTVPMIPLNPPVWVTSTTYSVGQFVINGGFIYYCAVANTSSSSFSTDLAAGDWVLQTAPAPLITPPAAWVTGTSYIIGQYVQNGGSYYVCTIAHTSGTFATDLAAGDWVLQAPVGPLLTPLPLMNDGCNNPYWVPPDFINPYLFSAPAFYRKETVRAPYLATPQIVLLTNNPNLATMKYVFNQQDLTQYSAKALEALATKLSWQLCFKISEAAQYAAALEKDYTMVKLISAITADSNTTSPDQSIANGWFIARLSGSTGAIGLGPDGNNVGWFIPGVEG